LLFKSTSAGCRSRPLFGNQFSPRIPDSPSATQQKRPEDLQRTVEANVHVAAGLAIAVQLQ
jgi:hypothetical protein